MSSCMIDSSSRCTTYTKPESFPKRRFNAFSAQPKSKNPCGTNFTTINISCKCTLWILKYSMTPGCPSNCFSNEDNHITLTGWISEWNLMIRIAPEQTVNAMIALGFHDDPSLLYLVTRNKTQDWEKYQILRRNVAHAFLFGEKAVGKVWIDSMCWVVFLATTSLAISSNSHLCTFFSRINSGSACQASNTKIRGKDVDYEWSPGE